MKFRNPFRFWPERIYSVPTVQGLLPLFITAVAGYFSFSRGSIAHQAFVVTMSLFTVIHLVESSKAMRSLTIAPDPDAMIYAGVPARLKLLVTSADPMPFLSLSVEFDQAGFFPYPSKRVDLVSPSGLFRFWRYIEFKEQAIVLPPPRDHGVSPESGFSDSSGDPDELHPIRDPRLLPLRDEKLFLKTGKSLLRARLKSIDIPTIRISHARLHHLSETDAFEQISHWVSQLEPEWVAGGLCLSVDVPFFSGSLIRTREEMQKFKAAFAMAARAHVFQIEGRNDG